MTLFSERCIGTTYGLGIDFWPDCCPQVAATWSLVLETHFSYRRITHQPIKCCNPDADSNLRGYSYSVGHPHSYFRRDSMWWTEKRHPTTTSAIEYSTRYPIISTSSGAVCISIFGCSKDKQTIFQKAKITAYACTGKGNLWVQSNLRSFPNLLSA